MNKYLLYLKYKRISFIIGHVFPHITNGDFSIPGPCNNIKELQQLSFLEIASFAQSDANPSICCYFFSRKQFPAPTACNRRINSYQDQWRANCFLFHSFLVLQKYIQLHQVCSFCWFVSFDVVTVNNCIVAVSSYCNCNQRCFELLLFLST